MFATVNIPASGLSIFYLRVETLEANPGLITAVQLVLLSISHRKFVDGVSGLAYATLPLNLVRPIVLADGQLLDERKAVFSTKDILISRGASRPSI
ncbi:MAG: hypothetical protein ACAF41_27270 [Leptolyngbya sp. BL-A-14]